VTSLCRTDFNSTNSTFIVDIFQFNVESYSHLGFSETLRSKSIGAVVGRAFPCVFYPLVSFGLVIHYSRHLENGIYQVRSVNEQRSVDRLYRIVYFVKLIL
jgi:hypothetical protein